MQAVSSPRLKPARWPFRGAVICATLAAAIAADGARRTPSAIAQGETRQLTFIHNHTKESVTVAFKRWGSYDSSALDQLNWLMRDWRRDEKIRMNPKLFDLVWEAHREAGSSSPIYINSAYRSPDTNAMLRRRSRAVSKHSQHMNGNALDFYLGDVSMSRVREVAMRMQRGGVGYYPNANTGFVHLDVGSVRSWPRMTRDQLARLFPDEMTVHLPAGGGTMARYEEARSMIVARGGSVGGYSGDEEVEGWSGGRGFFAALFGGGRGGGGGGGPVGNDDAGVRSFALNNGRTPSAPVAVAEAAPSRSLRGRRGAPAQPAEPAPTQVAAAQPSPIFSLFSSGPAPAQPARQAPAPQVEVPAPAPVTAAPIVVASVPPAMEPRARAVPVVAELPMPPRRPAEFSRTALAALANIPLPPARPNAAELVASASPTAAPAVDALGAIRRPTGDAEDRPAAAPAQAAAYAPVAAPRPALRPTAVVAASANALPARPAADAAPMARTRVLPTPVASKVALAPVDAILMEFRRKADVGPSAGVFSGAAVKPRVASAKFN